MMTPAQTAILERRLAQAEVDKATALAVLGGVSVVSLALVWGIGGLDRLTARSSAHLPLMLLVLMSAIVAWNLTVRVLARRRLVQRLPVPRLLSFVSVSLECSLPSVALWLSAAWVSDADLFGAPMLLAYGIAIALSALRLDLWLCLYSGGIAALTYLVVVLLVSVGADGLASEPTSHALRAAVVFLTGVSSAVVARSLRVSFEESLAAMEERNWVVGVFGRYVTDEVVEHLLHSPDGLRLGGQTRTVTVLMTDLRGFSKMSGRLPAEHVVGLLNHYLGAMTKVIQAHGGTIDEFIGDAILVIFNAPIDQPDHATAAVRCALAMQLEMAAVNRWNVEQGFTTIEMGIGVHTGDVVAGNIGSELRQKYGVVGAPVNLAARIEAQTVGGQVLVSGDTADRVDGLQSRGERWITPKGESAPVRIVDVSGLGELALEDDDDNLVDITPLEVALWQLESKVLSEESVVGHILACSDREVVLQTELVLVESAELCVGLGGGRFFAKVRGEHDRGLRLRLTAHDEASTVAMKRARQVAASAVG